MDGDISSPVAVAADVYEYSRMKRNSMSFSAGNGPCCKRPARIPDVECTIIDL